MRGERHHRGAFRPDARNLAIAERFRAGRALEGDREYEPALQSTPPGQELLDRDVARTVAALHRNGRIEERITVEAMRHSL